MRSPLTQVVAILSILGAAPAYSSGPCPEPDPGRQEPERPVAATSEMDKKLSDMSIDELMAIPVTGSRVEGRTATETTAPVDIIDNAAIRSTGTTETGKILQLLAPSFNFSTTTVSDGTDIIRPATLRSLGPDQLLVLVNGKRRHQQALLNVQQSIGRGSAGYDLDAIPSSAIDHIEVLRDGAAAQYGSDAIAGVINIILKGQTGGTDVDVSSGKYYAGDGATYDGSFNSGFRLGQKGLLDVTVEYRDRGETNRAGADSLRVDPPRVTQRIGDPIARDAALWLNGEVPAGNGHFYFFGGYSDRRGNASGFYRSPADGRTVPAIYPTGFLPTILTRPTDESLAGGYKGKRADWNYDLGVNWGTNRFKFREENTVNVSYWYEPVDPAKPAGARFMQSPTAANTGTLRNRQESVTFDANRKVHWGANKGVLNVATGLEWRRETYQITAGDPVSYQYGRTDNRSIPIFNQNGSIAQPGTQGFPGWSPREAGKGDRTNTAFYVDLDSQLTKRFLGGAALRAEHYSDFGSTVIGKLSGRMNFSDHNSIRATVSTGFRAPGVQQTFYSQRSTNLNSAGVLTDTLIARQNAEVTRAFGIPPLKEETSRNYSIGWVARPSQSFRLTVDGYRIDIANRIVFSSNIGPEDSTSCGTPFDAARCPIRAILDPLAVGQVLFFTNAIDTRTQGLDLVADYDHRLGESGQMTLKAALDFNRTKVTARASSSKILPASVLFDDSQVTLIEEGQPRRRIAIEPAVTSGQWRGNVRFNYFGKVAGEGFTPGLKQSWGGKWLTDLSVAYSLGNDLTLTVGALNIFNVYPDHWDPQKGSPFPQLGFTYGWETLPFGINGGYYYARMSYRFKG
ncbi:MAG TPA: TonB-dependent receptor [Thermoanaerobaculia bacterium]|nr:TonB-dependent receptor [Thermoanaerobaculia bacterium]